MNEYICIAEVHECPPGQCIEKVVAGRVLAICHVDDEFFALDGICPHQGGPLGQGQLCGDVLTCPWHGWQFDVRTGQHRLAASVRQPVIPIELDGERLVVRSRDLTDESSQEDRD